MTDALLEVAGLTTHLGSTRQPLRVVDGVDLTIRAGETVALLGESGCGKSLTALSLMRLLPPGGRIISGAARFDGTDLLRITEASMRSIRGGRLAMIFQEPQTALNPVMTVGAQIAEALRVHDGKASGALQQRAIELLDAVGIPDPRQRIRDYPHQLSGGMTQRIMIAMALAGHPRLLIADEPTTALDVTIQAQVLHLLKDLQRQTGMAVLLITHDLGVVAETADRLAVMYAGQIIERADCANFFAAPAHPYSQLLLHSVPTDTRRHQRLAAIPGRVPALDRVFQGCRFAERCAVATAICHQEPPPWQMIGVERGVRCHHWEAKPSAINSQPSTTRLGASVNADLAPDVLLQATDLTVHFPIYRGVLQRVAGVVRAVDGVSLTLHHGRTLALVGESGCGKTTVGKAILQLVSPLAGSIRYRDQELIGLNRRQLQGYRRDLQIIFQNPDAAMNPRMLVGDVIGEGLQALRIAPRHAARMRRVVELMEQVGLDPDAAHRYPHEFSGGQRQRICIARALAVAPQIIICDEPTSALDVSVQAQIINLLQDLQKHSGLAYLFITHNLSLVASLAHDVAVMYLGRIVEQGRVDEILNTPRHPYTRALLSAIPVINPRQRRALVRLEGDLPSPVQPPTGCHFHPRCPEATVDCARRDPEPVWFTASHQVRCFHASHHA